MFIIKKEIVTRVLNETEHILKAEDTIRNTAILFNVSKSTVHKDISERLLYIDKTLYKKIEKLMKKHIDIRHIKGGEATRKKYLLNR